MKRKTKKAIAKYTTIENNTKKIVQISVSIGTNAIIIAYTIKKFNIYIAF